jgi:hypothetical protein
MRREIRALVAKHGLKARLSAKEFWQDLSERMPYLDNGRLWNSIRPILRLPPFTGSLSFVSSVGLLQLAEEQILGLDFVADAQLGLRLKGSDRVVSTVTLQSSSDD